MKDEYQARELAHLNEIQKLKSHVTSIEYQKSIKDMENQKKIDAAYSEMNILKSCAKREHQLEEEIVALRHSLLY